LKASAMGYCRPVWLRSCTKGMRPSGLRYLDLRLVKPSVVTPKAALLQSLGGRMKMC